MGPRPDPDPMAANDDSRTKTSVNCRKFGINNGIGRDIKRTSKVSGGGELTEGRAMEINCRGGKKK